MIKNVIIAVVGFAAGAVTGVAAASSYFRKNGCEKCNARKQAEIEDAYQHGFEEGIKEMKSYKAASSLYIPETEINEFFELKNEEFKAAQPPFDTSKNEVFERKNEVFERISKAFDRETSSRLLEDRKNFITLTTREKFEDDADDSYDRYMWTYWVHNNVVSDECDERVVNQEEYVGRALEEIFKANPNIDTLYIRNDDKEAFYEVERVLDTYIEGPIPEVLFTSLTGDFYEDDSTDKEDDE